MAQARQASNDDLANAEKAKGVVNSLYGKQRPPDNNDPFAVINALKLHPYGEMSYERWLMERYIDPQTTDMILWGYVNSQRDEVIIRGYLRGESKARIARIMGIARTTVYRIILEYESKGDAIRTADQTDVSRDGITECDIVSPYPQSLSEDIATEKQEE